MLQLSENDVQLLVAVVRNKTVEKVGRIATNHPGQGPLREWLPMIVGAALAEDPSKGIQPFRAWNNLSMFQNGQPINSTADSTSIRPGLLICVINEDRTQSSEYVAHMLTIRWNEQKKDEQINDIADRLAPRLAERLLSGASVIPISQERHWLTSSAVLGLKRFFHKASDQVATKLEANPTRREDGLTNELVFEVFSNRQNQSLLDSYLSKSGVEIRLECEESGSAEQVLGADLGICLTIMGKGLFTRRAILLQAKRLHPNPDQFAGSSRYGDLLESKGIDQARKMLDVSPSSYFILYNPSCLHEVLNINSQHKSEVQIGSSLDYCSDGICILPASMASGMDKYSWQNVMDLYPFTCSFVKFMVDDFIQGKVGDCSKRAVRASLTRRLRQAFEIGDDQDIHPPRFSISFMLKIGYDDRH